MAAIELQDPSRDVVEKVAVMGDQHDGAGVFAQVTLEPRHRFGIQMVRRLVQQQHVGRFEQKLAQRDAAFFAAREVVHVGQRIGAAQRVHCHLDLRLQIPKVLGVDLVLQRRHFFGGVVRIIGGDLVVAIEQRFFLGHAFHHIADHVELRIEFGFLRQKTHAHAFGSPGFADIVPLLRRHDAQQRRLSGAVQTDDADLRARKEREPNVAQHLTTAGIGLGQTLHHENILIGGHLSTLAVGKRGPGRGRLPWPRSS